MMIKKKGQKKIDGELIYGIHPVVELLKAKRRKLVSLYTTKPTPKSWKDIEHVLPRYPVPIQYVTRDVLTRMAGTTDHQGVVAWVQPFPIRKKFFDPKKQKFLLMLDGVQDPRNLGAILRSTYCTGFQGVILILKGGAPLNAAALKASVGLAEHLEITIFPSAQAAMLALKDAGYTVYLAGFKGEQATACSFKEPLCLVVGSEGFGISKELYKHGIPITLAQKTADISYNVSVAAGILLFLVSSQHHILE